MPHVRICAGGAQQWASLPRLPTTQVSVHAGRGAPSDCSTSQESRAAPRQSLRSIARVRKWETASQALGAPGWRSRRRPILQARHTTLRAPTLCLLTHPSFTVASARAARGPMSGERSGVQRERPRHEARYSDPAEPPYSPGLRAGTACRSPRGGIGRRGSVGKIAGHGGLGGSAVSEPASRPFLTGVADETRRLAFISTPQGEIVAVDLAEGRELWRGAAGQRPLVVADNRLLTLALGSAGASVRQLALTTGTPADPEIPLPLPAWVAGGQGRLEVCARATSGDIELSWRAWAGYTGGAPPPPAVRAASRKEASGRVRIELNKATAREIPAAPDAACLERMDTTAVPPPPGVLAAASIGDVSYSLRPVGRQAGPPRLVLEARDAAGVLLWTLTVDETLPIRPPPLRH